MLMPHARARGSWGHTIGHAIEALKSPAYMHGECVAVGCVAEAEVTQASNRSLDTRPFILTSVPFTPPRPCPKVTLRLGIESKLDRAKIERISACFASYGLPVYVPRGLAMEQLMKKMALDKKNRGNTIKCTIVTDIGVSIAQPQPVPSTVMEEVMQESMDAGVAAGAEWTPHEGKVAQQAAGGLMAS